MLRLRAWVFFSVLLLIGILLVGTAPSFQACLKQGSPQAATTAAPQAHGTTVLVAQSTRECLAQFYNENRDDIIAASRFSFCSPPSSCGSPRAISSPARVFPQVAAPAPFGPSETFITGVAAGEKPVVECTIRNFGQTPGAPRGLLGRLQSARFDVRQLRPGPARGRRAHCQSRPRRLHHQVAPASSRSPRKR